MAISIYEENPVLKILQSIDDISMDSFKNRLRYQKIAYLSQQLNSDDDFTFTYYQHGPYSPRLTKLLYKGTEMNAFSNTVKLSEQEDKTIKLIIELMGDQFEDNSALELFATVWYLLPLNQTAKWRQEEVIEIISKTKPKFEREQIQAAMDRILEFRQKYKIR